MRIIESAAYNFLNLCNNMEGGSLTHTASAFVPCTRHISRSINFVVPSTTAACVAYIYSIYAVTVHGVTTILSGRVTGVTGDAAAQSVQLINVVSRVSICYRASR